MTIKGYLFFSRPNPTDEVPDPEWEILNEVPEPAENFLIEGLDSNTDFEFAAKAVDLAGNESEMSEPLDVSTLTYTHNDDPLDEEDQLAIDSIVKNYMKEIGLANTVQIAVTGPRGHYTQGYGVYKSPDYHWRIGSNTKLFTATAVLQCIQDGLLSLDDTIEQFGVTWSVDAAHITIRHLLMMRAGIFDYTQDSSFGLMMYLWPTAATWTNMAYQHSLAFARGQLWPAGKVYYYCNTNFLVLGDIVEKIREKTIGEVVEQDILAPLGMTETTWLPWVPPAPTMPGYGWDMLFGAMPILGGIRNQTGFNPYAFKSSGQMSSTVKDMTKWALELCNSTLLEPEINALRQERFSIMPLAMNEGIDKYGYGLGFVSMGNWLGHDGSVPGYSSVCMYDPESEATSVGVENFQTPGIAIMSKLMPRIWNYLYPERAGMPNYPRYLEGIPSAEAFGRTILGDLEEILGFVAAGTPKSATGYFTNAIFSDAFDLPSDTEIVFAVVSRSSQGGLSGGVQFGGRDMTALISVSGVTLYYLLDPPTGPVTFAAWMYGYGFNNCSGVAWAYKGAKKIGTPSAKAGNSSAFSHTVPVIGSDARAIHIMAAAAGNITNYNKTTRSSIHSGSNPVLFGDAAGTDNADTTFSANVPPGDWWSFIIPILP